MMSSTYKFKMATRQNLTRRGLCCLPIGWYLPVCFIEWLEQKLCQRRIRKWGEAGTLVQGAEERAGRERMEAPSPVHHPSPAKKPSPMREEEKRMEEAEKQVEEARWLEDVGRSLSSLPTQQLAQMAMEAGPSDLEGRSQSGGSSDLPWEAKPPRRNSSGLVKWRRPGSTGLAQLLFKRSGSSRRALNSSSGNSPSCS